MTPRREYRKKTASTVVAVQLDLETDGFTYDKWGGTQTCKQGDWVVRYRNWHWLDNKPKMKGFQGIRYVDRLPEAVQSVLNG